ncbi:MAG: hypothetical protein PHU44_08425 [Syntrophales bacterium]|nr:hypothetical protein [Syntrophales bacterium]
MRNKPDRENMKSLSFGMVSDISRLLADRGFADSPIDIVEALAFAMYIIADTYSLAKPDKEQAIAVIHAFYEDMQDHFVNQVVVRDHQMDDEAELLAVAAKFHELSRDRFHQYGARFKEDIADPMSMSCPVTVSYLLDNLFIDPITPEEKINLVGAVSEKVLIYWSGCVQSFRADMSTSP